MELFSPQKIQLIIESKMPGSKATVRDMTGTNDHFELEVVASQFEGKSLVELGLRAGASRLDRVVHVSPGN